MPDKKPSPKWVTVAEAVELLGVSERTLRRWIKEKKLPKRKKDRKGRGVLVDISGERLQAPRHDDDMTVHDTRPVTDERDIELAELRVKVQMLTDQLEEEKEKSTKQAQEAALYIEHWRVQAQAAISHSNRLLEDGRQRRFRWPWQRGEE